MAPIYTAAVIGVGMGGKLSLKALAASPDFELVAFAELHQPTRQAILAEYPGVQSFADYGELFRQCPVDVVCIATWPPSHRDIVQAALALPLKGLLVEKPLADNHADGAAILAAIRQRQLPVVIPHGLLVAEHSRQVMELVQHGRIGTLKLIEIQCRGWDIINAGIHWLNFVVALTWNQPVQSVLAACDTSTRTFRDNMQVESEAITYLQLADGVRVVMHTGDTIPISEPDAGVLFRLIGSKGMIEFFGWKSAYRLYDAQHPQGNLVEITPAPQSNHQIYLELLASQITYQQPDYRWPDYSLAALELCEAAYLSHRYRCTISLPLSQFVPPPVNDWQPGQPYSGQGGGRDGRKLT